MNLEELAENILNNNIKIIYNNIKTSKVCSYGIYMIVDSTYISYIGDNKSILIKGRGFNYSLNGKYSITFEFINFTVSENTLNSGSISIQIIPTAQFIIDTCNILHNITYNLKFPSIFTNLLDDIE